MFVLILAVVCVLLAVLAPMVAMGLVDDDIHNPFVASATFMGLLVAGGPAFVAPGIVGACLVVVLAGMMLAIDVYKSDRADYLASRERLAVEFFVEDTTLVEEDQGLDNERSWTMSGAYKLAHVTTGVGMTVSEARAYMAALALHIEDAMHEARKPSTPALPWAMPRAYFPPVSMAA